MEAVQTSTESIQKMKAKKRVRMSDAVKTPKCKFGPKSVVTVSQSVINNETV